MQNRDFEAETAAAYAEMDEPIELSEEEFRLATEGDDREDMPEEEHLHFSAPAVPPLDAIVVGSLDWDEPLVVQAALLGWAQQHAGRDFVLWTTDAPEGAEATARHFAGMQGWRTVTVPPEGLLDAPATIAFGFLVPGAVGSADLVADLAARRPVRVFTVESRRPNSRWRNY